MEVQLAWQLLWLALALSAVVSFRTAFFRAFALQGKMRTPAAVAQLPGLTLLRIEVPKSYWTGFYLVGAAHTMVVLYAVGVVGETSLVQTALHFLQSATGAKTLVVQPCTLLFLALYAVHTTRRFLECVFVTQFGNARMHLSIFFVGTLHYVGTVLSVLSDPDSVAPHHDTILRRVLCGLGVVLYLVAVYHQSRCNYLMAQQKKQNGMKHVIPRGDWFDAVRSPLYTSEVLLYVAFILVAGGTTRMLYFILLWVLLNQTLLAHFSSDWMDQKFRDRRHEMPRWKLFPYVW